MSSPPMLDDDDATERLGLEAIEPRAIELPLKTSLLKYGEPENVTAPVASWRLGF